LTLTLTGAFSRRQRPASPAARFELGELPVELLGSFHTGECRFEIVLGEVEERAGARGLLAHLVLDPTESGLRRDRARLVRDLSRPRPRAGSPVLGDQQRLLVFCLAHLRLELGQRLSQELDVLLVLLGLLDEQLGRLAKRVVSLERALGQSVLST